MNTKLGAVILIVEDDADIRGSVTSLLQTQGFNVIQTARGKEGLAKFNSSIDLIILDIMLPDLSGITVCEQIRAVSTVPILFLTAKSEEADIVTGFAAGGDDYLVKPFSSVELSVRIKAMLRRYEYSKVENRSHQSQWLSHKNLKVNTSQNEVLQNNNKIFLTYTEYQLLLLLMTYPGQIFSVKRIYENIWKEPFREDNSNTVMVHIRNLRKKIGDNSKRPEYILTMWGRGYKLGADTTQNTD